MLFPAMRPGVICRKKTQRTQRFFNHGFTQINTDLQGQNRNTETPAPSPGSISVFQRVSFYVYGLVVCAQRLGIQSL
jgi:hypothetical protein